VAEAATVPAAPPTPRLPPAAEQVLERGTLCHVAVGTSFGPHLTPMVFALDGGRLWVTTARRTAKAGAWRRDPRVAGMVRHGDEAVAFRGVVRTYDALDPLSWPAAVLGAPLLARAAARFSVKNARFFAGYAVDAGRVPLAWTPPGRVFAAIAVASGALLGREGSTWRVADAWGEWPAGTARSTSFAALPAARGLDLRVPASVRERLGDRGEGALAMQAGGRLTVLPVSWRRVGREGAFDAALPEALLELAGTGPTAPAALTVDRASRWRAAEMAGMLLRGTGHTFAVGATRRGRTGLRARLEAAAPGTDPAGMALLRLRPDRVVWWEGWTSGTVGRPGRDRKATARGRPMA
jgi:Pyridoxamine 5'-phosphate oxidase